MRNNKLHLNEKLRKLPCGVLIIGGCRAGLRAAIEAHDSGEDVLIVSKSRKGDPHTVLATEGINGALGPFFERFFYFRRAQRVPVEKPSELGHNAINRRVRWDLNKNLFESKWLGFRRLLLEVSRLCFQRKTFKIENGTIAVKAMY